MGKDPSEPLSSPTKQQGFDLMRGKFLSQPCLVLFGAFPRKLSDVWNLVPGCMDLGLGFQTRMPSPNYKNTAAPACRSFSLGDRANLESPQTGERRESQRTTLLAMSRSSQPGGSAHSAENARRHAVRMYGHGSCAADPASHDCKLQTPIASGRLGTVAIFIHASPISPAYSTEVGRMPL